MKKVFPVQFSKMMISFSRENSNKYKICGFELFLISIIFPNQPLKFSRVQNSKKKKNKTQTKKKVNVKKVDVWLMKRIVFDYESACSRPGDFK